MQRILKYPLLLKRLIKETNPVRFYLFLQLELPNLPVFPPNFRISVDFFDPSSSRFNYISKYGQI